jgi:hypothetical protein
VIPIEWTELKGKAVKTLSPAAPCSGLAIHKISRDAACLVMQAKEPKAFCYGWSRLTAKGKKSHRTPFRERFRTLYEEREAGISSPLQSNPYPASSRYKKWLD